MVFLLATVSDSCEVLVDVGDLDLGLLRGTQALFDPYLGSFKDASAGPFPYSEAYHK